MRGCVGSASRSGRCSSPTTRRTARCCNGGTARRARRGDRGGRTRGIVRAGRRPAPVPARRERADRARAAVRRARRAARGAAREQLPAAPGGVTLDPGPAQKAPDEPRSCGAQPAHISIDRASINPPYALPDRKRKARSRGPITPVTLTKAPPYQRICKAGASGETRAVIAARAKVKSTHAAIVSYDGWRCHRSSPRCEGACSSVTRQLDAATEARQGRPGA
jgi:hypothetical protein